MSERVEVSLKDRIEEILPQADSFTGYQLAGFASQLCGRYVREQTVYSYVRQGFIPSIEVSGKKRVSREAAAAWLEKYVSRNA